MKDLLNLIEELRESIVLARFFCESYWEDGMPADKVVELWHALDAIHNKPDVMRDRVNKILAD